MKKGIVKHIVRAAGLFTALSAIVVFIPAYWMAPVAPTWSPKILRDWAYDMRLLIGRPAAAATSFVHAIRGDFSVYFPVQEEEVFYYSQGLRIAGTVCRIADNSKKRKKAVLLVHGSTPQGRKLGLYRVLMRRLAEKDYVVMSIDLRGFGQSDDPPEPLKPESFNFTADIKNAVLYMQNIEGVDGKRIFLVGHSYGGDAAISAAAARDIPVMKLALIGPGRRFMERGGSVDAPEFEYFRRRDMRYMSLSSSIPVEVFQQYRSGMPIESHIDYLSSNEHIPILLMDCEYEGREDHLFLRRIYDSIKSPKAFFTVDDADHYMNVANIGPLVFYDNKALTRAVAELDHFFKTD